MSSIPETERQHQDFVDIMIEAVKSEKEVQDIQGLTKKEMIPDAKKLWYKTQIINSPTFARFVFVLEEFGNMAHDAFNHMTFERANVLGNQIFRKINSYNFSIDAKSSETVQDKHNNRGSLVHLMTNKTIEKKFTMKDEMKKGLAAGWFGGQDETK